MDEFDWATDDEDELDSFDSDDESFWGTMDETIHSYPKTTAGMVGLFKFLKDYSDEDGWRYLWTEYEELMDTKFRMMVALHIATQFSDKRSFPGFYSWLRTLDKECLPETAERDNKLTLMDVISRDLQNGAFVASIDEENDLDLLRIAMSINTHRTLRRDSNLVAVCWNKARPIGKTDIQIAPCVDFIRKDTLHEFKEVPCYENILLQDIAHMDYHDVLTLVLQKLPVKPIRLSSHTLFSTLLNAEVPICVANSSCGSVAKCFLKGYLNRIIKEKQEFEHPFARHTASKGEELTAKETERLIRAVFVFNKISLYQALADIYRELARDQ